MRLRDLMGRSETCNTVHTCGDLSLRRRECKSGRLSHIRQCMLLLGGRGQVESL